MTAFARPKFASLAPKGKIWGWSNPQQAWSWPKKPDLILSKSRPMQSRRSARSWILASINTNSRKREAEARKKQKIIEIKEIKFRPNTDTNDYEVKMRKSIFRFLEEGDKVKVTMRFRGREMAHQNIGAELLSPRRR
jgi:translation initiation factor IF-3